MNFHTLFILFSFLFSAASYAADGSLILSTDPKTANIYVDGLLRANITPITLKLPAGRHLVEIKHAGKQPESLDLFIKDGEREIEQVTLLDLPPSRSSEVTEINILKILNPLRGYLETTSEFTGRRQQLLNGFNQRVRKRDTSYQAGIAILDKEHYDPVSGMLPVTIQRTEWTRQFTFPERGSIAILSEDAKPLWEEGLEKPVYLYFELSKNETVVSQVVLVGNQREWVIGEISGYLPILGADELANLMTLWMEKYHTHYPNVQFQLLLENTATVPTTFIDGNNRVAWLPRKMTAAELKQFTDKYGYPPLELRVAMEVLAIYVQEHNPVKGLTLPQLDAMFSATRKCGVPDDIQMWGQLEFDTNWIKETLKNLVHNLKSRLGLGNSENEAEGGPPPIDWNTLPIQLVGRPSTTSAYHFFRQQALCGGEFKKSVKQPAEEFEEMIKFVSDSPGHIGFSTVTTAGLAGVRTVSIHNDAAGWFSSSLVEPTADHAMAGDYPLTRFVWMYVNQSPEKPLPTVFQKLIRFIFSEDGQKIAKQQELTPLTIDFMAEELEKLK